jgi:murein DD-endopeptidase MepM/ murein hydrolase activator NlpD
MLLSLVLLISLGLLAPAPAAGTALTDLRLGAAVNESRCAIVQAKGVFEVKNAQVYVQFIARGVPAGENLRIDWVTPAGDIHDSAIYEQLPASSALCFISALPVAGAPAMTLPGEWRVRVSLNGTPAAEKPFQIQGPPDDGSPRILSLDYRNLENGQSSLEILAWRANAETSVNLARLKPGGEWEYVVHLLADTLDGGRMRVTLPALEPARYLVVLRSPDGRLSPPSPLELFSGTGYYLPALAGASWRITQRPFGTFSHWGRSIHAWDLAPVENRLVAAMRAGIVHAYDRRQGQNIRSRSFGNYVTIDHGDGEYSHYAHLRSGTFLVRTGERVEAGQALAEVGNSGYSFGTHVHVHVTRAFPIASMSIPFRFADVENDRASVVVAGNRYQGGRLPKWQGKLGFAEWWSEGLTVPRGTKRIELRHGAKEGKAGFDLHAVSPTGRRYTLPAAQAEESLKIETPEAGGWRVWVQAVEGEGLFWVDVEMRR